MPSALFGGALFGVPGTTPTPSPGTGSVAERLAHAAAGVLAALDWGTTGDPPAAVVPLVKVRRRPELAAQDGCSATQPVVVVCIKRGTKELLWAGTVMQSYALGVYLFAPTPAGLGPTAQINAWTEAVGRAVHGDGTFAGVPECNEVFPADQLPWDTPSLDKNYTVTTVAARVECIEPRA